MSKEKFQLEYNLNSSLKILYNRLSTAGGLNEWFADNVQVQGKTFTFEWDGTFQKARVTSKKNLNHIKFQWLDSEDDKAYFEFRLEIEELTREIALIITDFADKEEIGDAKELWDTQISKLKRVLGL